MATSTRSFGAGNRESHDSSAFYARGLAAAEFSTDDVVNDAPEVDRVWCHSAEKMPELPDSSVALMVTSPGYHVGKEYDTDVPFEEYLSMLERVCGESSWRRGMAGGCEGGVAQTGVCARAGRGPAHHVTFSDKWRAFFGAMWRR